VFFGLFGVSLSAWCSIDGCGISGEKTLRSHASQKCQYSREPSMKVSLGREQESVGAAEFVAFAF